MDIECNKIYLSSSCIWMGMSILELSSYLLEIPNNAYKLLSQFMIGCSLLSQEYYKLISWYWIIWRSQLYTLTCPIVRQGGTTNVSNSKLF